MTSIAQTTSGLNELDLLNLDPEKDYAVPQSRLKDVNAAVAIYNTLRRADERSAVNRSRMDAMFDGAPPHDQKVLNSTGQGSRTNLNFGESQRYLDVAMSAFVDLYSSLETLVRVKVTAGEESLRAQIADIIAEEATATLRSLPEFHSNYLRLCTEFTKHGVGVTYFDNPKDWRFRVCGLSDFLIPRQTQASEDSIEVAVARRQYLLHELYGFVSNEEVATNTGWNVEETKRVIVKNARTTGRASGATFADWEATQRELKNNDIYTGLENTTVDVLHIWVREFNGSVSHFMCAEESPKDFLFQKVGMFDAPERAYLLFSYGVGTNGTYHSVRGLGHRIFNHVQTSNRMRCQRVDSAMMAGSVMIQPETQRALEDLSFTMYGPYSILSPNVRVVEKVVPNLTQSMEPAIADIENQLSMNVDLMSTYGNRSSPYRNELQTEHDLAVSSRLTGSTINLFYASWTRLLREVIRRLVSGDRKDRAVRDFFDRCADRGVPAELVKSVDFSKTIAVRAIGSGSQANRLLALRELNQISGSYDEVGRHNLIRHITATRVGYDLADQFVPANPEPRTTVDAKIALLENQLMQTGVAVPVLDSEIHAMHLRAHAPVLDQLLVDIDEGTADPVQALPLVQALTQHVSEHANYLAADPMAKAESAAARQLLQKASEVIVNYTRKVQAEARKQAIREQRDGAAQAAGDPNAAPADPNAAPAGPTPAELKMQLFEMQREMVRQKAEQEMAIRQAKADQELAIKDALRAAEFAGNGTA